MLVQDRLYALQQEFEKEFRLDDHQFCMVLDTMTAAVDEMKKRCANYLENRANEIESGGSVTAYTIARIYREEAKAIETFAV